MIATVLHWFFACLFFAIGSINVFWGNDPFFGVFILVLSLMYIPPMQKILVERWGRPIPFWVKLGTGLFILWASLGVGELLDKIQLMLRTFS